MATHPRLLRYILVRTVPLAALFFVVAGLVADHFIKKEVTSEVERRLSLSAEMAALQVDTKLRTLTDILDVLAGNKTIATGLVDPAVRQSMVQPFIQNLTMPGIPDALVLVADFQGKPVAMNRPVIGSDGDLAWVGDVMTGGKYIHIGEDGVRIAIPIYYDGRLEGVIVTQLDDIQLRAFLALEPMADTATLVLNGEILDSINEGFETGRNGSAVDGAWITSAAASKIYPPLRVELAAPTEQAFAVVSDVDKFVGLAMVAAMIVLVSALVLMAFSITRPLTRFVKKLKSFKGASDLTRRVASPNIAEFAEVAEAFNLMLARLRRALVSHDQLETENRHRRQAEQVVREKEAETQAIVDNVLDGIITITDDGTIRTVNAAAKELFGYSAYEMVGRNVRMLMPEPHRAMHDGYIHNYLRTGDAKIIGIGREVTGLRKNGERFPMELGISVMTIRGERQFTGMVRDITERKRIDRMKNEFISVVSHELRTPLTSLAGSLTLVGGGAFGSLPDKAQTLISIAHNNAQRLIHLVNHILDVEKIESGMIELELERLDPVALVQKAITENAAYGEKYGVTFVLRNDLGEAAVEADAQRLMQILANLLSNAAKFSGEGTEVEVSLEKQDCKIRFAIKDQGAGIPEEGLGKLFEKFSQIDSSDSRGKDGTGLGLNISQGIARLHGSEIRVDSEVGKGSTFYFDLDEKPLADPTSRNDSGGRDVPVAAAG